MFQMKKISRIKQLVKRVVILFLILGIASCGGDTVDDNDNDGVDFVDLPPVVFMADKDTKGTVELYVSFQTGEDIRKLSGDMVAGGGVVAFQVSPDGIFVAYVADQDTNQIFELYVVNVDKTATDSEVKVSETPTADNGIKKTVTGEFSFAWAPDSSRIAYLADQRTAGIIELFSVQLDGTNNIRLSGPLGATNDVEEFAWAPNSSRIAYIADQSIDDVLELYTASPNVAGSSIRVTSGMVPGRNVTDFAWAPDSSLLAFIADKTIQDFLQLWTTSPINSNNVPISGGIVADGDVIDFSWAPNSSRIAYLADVFEDGIFELFSTLPTSLNSTRIASDPQGFINKKVSANLVLGGDVFTFQWEPESNLIAYNADGISDNVVELFTTTAPPSSLSIKKVSGDMAGFGAEDNFQWAPDSSLLAYLADQDEVNVIELFTSAPDGSKNDRSSGDLVLGGNVSEFEWEPGSQGVAYIAEQDTFGVNELYVSTPSGSNNVKISGSLVPGGSVFQFEWAP
jgi:uncharacterized protein with WD repeat